MVTFVAVSILAVTGCSGDDGLSQAEVDAAIAEAIGALPEPGLRVAEVDELIGARLDELTSLTEPISRVEMKQAIEDAIAELGGQQATAEPGTADGQADMEGTVASAPSKSDPANYTQHVVQQAIERYESEGLAAALAYYNSPDSVDGQWYVFIVDRNADVIGHYDPRRLDLNLLGFAGTDINGYKFGPEMLAADEAGRWVPYVYANPSVGTLEDDGAFELKNAWVVRHDGLLFGSGWYINSEEFLPALISEAAGHFRTGGLEAILAFYNSPQGISAGLIPTVEYYNSTNTLDGYFSGFITAPDGDLLSHVNPELIGTHIEDLLGPAVRNATAQGAWITAADNPADAGPESMRIWVVDVDGTLIGGGWYRD